MAAKYTVTVEPKPDLGFVRKLGPYSRIKTARAVAKCCLAEFGTLCVRIEKIKSDGTVTTVLLDF